MNDPTKTHRRDTVVEMLKLMWLTQCMCVLVVKVKMELQIDLALLQPVYTPAVWPEASPCTQVLHTHAL